MPSHKVGVFPASGGIGGGTVNHLLSRLPPENLVFIARNPSRLSSAADQGATIRQADYDSDVSLEHAFEGVGTLFLISYASIEHEHRTQRHRLAIDYAIKSGVRYIFYGSLGFAGSPDSSESVAYVMQPHLDTERYLAECGRQNSSFDYTIIREGLYSESYPLYTAFFDPKNPVDKIQIPHDGSGPGIHWVKRDELGEGTAEIISRFVKNPTGFDMRKRTVLLSGPRALTLHDTVSIPSEIANVPVSIVKVFDDEFAAQPKVKGSLTYRGVDLSKQWATAFEALRRGEGSFVSPLLKELIGREPEDFRTTISRTSGA